MVFCAILIVKVVGVRAAMMSLAPTTTGSATAVALIYRELEAKRNSYTVCGPVGCRADRPCPAMANAGTLAAGPRRRHRPGAVGYPVRHSDPILAYAGSEKAAADVGFDSAANATGRLLGSAVMLAICRAISFLLPSRSASGVPATQPASASRSYEYSKNSCDSVRAIARQSNRFCGKHVRLFGNDRPTAGTTNPMYRRALAIDNALLTRGKSMQRQLGVGDVEARLDGKSGSKLHAASAGDPRSLIEALPDAALFLDARGTVIAANGAANEVLGKVYFGEHIGRTARQPELAAAIRSTLASGQKAVFELALKSPAERHLDGSVSRLSDCGEGANAPAFIVILQDISERETLARMRMEFVANASHELRTPLAAVSGFIETLRGSAKDDPVARERFLGIMSEQAQRMTRLIDDLLLLSRVEMRAHLPPSTQADLNHVAAEAIRLAAPQAKKDATVLQADLTEADTKLPGDHDELMQAAQNFLQNALKYGRPGGKVIVRTAREQDRRGGEVLRFSVIDDGPGIGPEHLPRLTERFYRVSTAASREKGGTGLGLAIVKHIAVRHRGRVEVQSAVGQGSTFSLVFPVP